MATSLANPPFCRACGEEERPESSREEARSPSRPRTPFGRPIRSSSPLRLREIRRVGVTRAEHQPHDGLTPPSDAACTVTRRNYRPSAPSPSPLTSTLQPARLGHCPRAGQESSLGETTRGRRGSRSRRIKALLCL